MIIASILFVFLFLALFLTWFVVIPFLESISSLEFVVAVVIAHALEELVLGFRSYQAVHFGTGNASVPTSRARGLWVDRVGLSALMIAAWWLSSSWPAAAPAAAFVLGIAAADLVHHAWLEMQFRRRWARRHAPGPRGSRRFTPGLATAIAGYGLLLYFELGQVAGAAAVAAFVAGAAVIAGNYALAARASRLYIEEERARARREEYARQGPPAGWPR